MVSPCQVVSCYPKFYVYFRQKLAEQEKRLDELEMDMERIRVSDDAANQNMTELDAEADKVMEKLDSLREQKQSISKVSSVGKRNFILIRLFYKAFAFWGPLTINNCAKCSLPRDKWLVRTHYGCTLVKTFSQPKS